MYRLFRRGEFPLALLAATCASNPAVCASVCRNVGGATVSCTGVIVTDQAILAQNPTPEVELPYAMTDCWQDESR